MKRLALYGLLFALALPAAAETQQPLDQSYLLSRGMLTLGEAHFRLTPQTGTDCWRYEYEARPVGLARLFIGQISERSDFCVIDDVVRSKRFEFRRADKPSENFDLDFDWQARTVRSSSGEMRELQSGMIDRLAMQIAIQRWVVSRQGQPGAEEFSAIKVEDERVKTYRFRITGRETVEVPAGKIDTVRVERVNDPKKSTRFWLAPDRAYAAVRVEQTKGGDEQIKMLLK